MKQKMWIVVDVVINCGYDDITKKNEKSRIEYDINGRKFEFWMKKNYSIDDMFIRCIYVLYQ